MNALASKLYKRITNFSLAVLVSVSALTAVTPFMFSESANAAPGIVYGSTGLGSLTFGPDRATPSGGYDLSADTLTLRVDNTNASSLPGTFYQTEGLQAPISDSKSIQADLFVDPAWETHPVRAGMWGVAGSETAGDVAWPIIEFYNVDGTPTWRVFDTIYGGYTTVGTPAYGTTYTVEITFNAATKQYDYYIDDLLVVSKDAYYGTDTYGRFQAVIFNNYNSKTTSADDYSVTWNNFKTGVAPTVSECSEVNPVYISSLAAWDTSETRATGHNEITEEGLRVWTEGSTSTDKAAAYLATDFALADTGDDTIAEMFQYTTAAGTIAPGLQMVVDFDNDGTVDGILVGESVYGNDWWLSNGSQQFVKDGAPLHTGGFGSDNHGTLNQWLESFPDAQVKSIGYSLGSGVYGDYTITRISLGCTEYTFGPEIASEQPTDNNGSAGNSGTTTTTTTTITTTNTPIITNPASILGATDSTNTEGESDVEGTTDDKTATAENNTDGVILGLMWYWWILILAGAAGLTWWIIAAYRRRNTEE